MPKVNINTASREELVEGAGLRPDLADAILKFRGKHGGKITDVQALQELPGVGPATIEQLRKSLDFSKEKASNGEGKNERAGNGAGRAARETAEKSADGAASVARSTAEAERDAMEAGAQTGSTAARSGLQLVQRTSEAVEEVQHETARQSAEGTAEIAKLWIDVLNEQTRHNLQVVAMLGRAMNWDDIVQAQSEFMRSSFERLNQLNGRYLELVQAMMRSTTQASDQQPRKTT
jgi:competence ComEA-like helix-hairpin-helix protein